VKNLTENAEICSKAWCDDDPGAVGACLAAYWDHKKCMAGPESGAEPPHVKAMIKCLKPHIFGSSLAGAGGGGYLFAVTKKPDDIENIRAVLEANGFVPPPVLSGSNGGGAAAAGDGQAGGSAAGVYNVVVHSVTVDQSGLHTTIGEGKSPVMGPAKGSKIPASVPGSG
jgi:hypothetical protein